MKLKPVHEIRIGSIKAAIWENAGAAGVFHTVTLNRLYRDGGGWKFTDGFGREDLLVVAKVADTAHSWICAHRVESPEDGKGTGDCAE